MQEKLVGLPLAYFSAQTDADDIEGIGLPTGVGFTIVGVGFGGVKSAGSNAANVDIKDDGVAVTGFSALEIAAAADGTGGFTTYIAGTAPVHIAAASEITCDLNLSTENMTGIVMIWGYWDEA